jgi:hypothetical protein
MIIKPQITAAIALIVLLLLGNQVKSQITLDHTYNGWASVANLDISGYKFTFWIPRMKP